MIDERVKWISEFSLINNHYLICAFWITLYLKARKKYIYIFYSRLNLWYSNLNTMFLVWKNPSTKESWHGNKPTSYFHIHRKDKDKLDLDSVINRKFVFFLFAIFLLYLKNMETFHSNNIQSLYSSLEKEMATHSSIFAWEIPWTEESGGLQSMGLQRVRHNWATEHGWTLLAICSKIHSHFPKAFSIFTICSNDSACKSLSPSNSAQWNGLNISFWLPSLHSCPKIYIYASRDYFNELIFWYVHSFSNPIVKLKTKQPLDNPRAKQKPNHMCLLIGHLQGEGLL